MIGLIYNEITKVVAQRRFAVVIIILTLLAVVSALAARSIHGLQQMEPITAAQTIGSGVTGGAAQLLFPFLFAIIIGDIFAGELTSGTMKLLLIRPVSRWKIWLSKFLGAFLVSVAVVLYCGLCSYAALGASIGFGSFSAPEGGIYNITTSAGMITLRAYGLEMCSILSVISVFMLISTVVESGVAAVGLCASLAVVCSMAVPIIKFIVTISPRARWIEYAFFEHWQVAGVVNKSFPLDSWTLTGSLVTLAVWTILFIAAGVAIFQIKDVKG
jgi:ABC-2 type transport system permease protein